MELPQLPQPLIEKIFSLAELPEICGMYKYEVCKKKKNSKVKTLLNSHKANLLLQPHAICKITSENYNRYDFSKKKELSMNIFYFFKDIDENTVLWSSFNGGTITKYKIWLEKFDLWKKTTFYKVKHSAFIPKDSNSPPYDVHIGYRLRDEVMIVRIPPVENKINSKLYLANLEKS